MGVKARKRVSVLGFANEAKRLHFTRAGVVMSSYIFVSPGSDPGMGRPLADPILRAGIGVRSTMGTCRPDLRKRVQLGDQIFVVSGSMGKNVQQYVIGGLEIQDRLASQIAAFNQFPENRLYFNDAGQRLGNIIVTEDGRHHPQDRHSNFETRIQNYLVGTTSVLLETPQEVELGRERSVAILSRIFDKPGASRMQQVIGRMRKLSDDQAGRLKEALQDLKRDARRI